MKMNGKIMMLSLMSLLMIGMVSAFSVENIESNYNRKDNTVSFSYDKVLNNECAPVDIRILDHKGNLVGGRKIYGFVVCTIGLPGFPGHDGSYTTDNRKTGTFSSNKDYQLVSKKDIKGLGRLTYEIVNHYGHEVLATGDIK